MGQYDWKKTAKKVLLYTGLALVSGLVSLWQDDAKYQVLFPLLVIARDYLKHKQGLRFVP